MGESPELPLRVHDRVRLREDFQGLDKGAEGVIIGFYRNEPPRYLVNFGGPSRQVPPEYLEPFEEQESS